MQLVSGHSLSGKPSLLSGRSIFVYFFRHNWPKKPGRIWRVGIFETAREGFETGFRHFSLSFGVSVIWIEFKIASVFVTRPANWIWIWRLIFFVYFFFLCFFVKLIDRHHRPPTWFLKYSGECLFFVLFLFCFLVDNSKRECCKRQSGLVYFVPLEAPHVKTSGVLHGARSQSRRSVESERSFRHQVLSERSLEL